VERFSIGFPPHILRIRGRRTEYCIGAIPLGGYVKVDLGTNGETEPTTPWHARLAAAAAGPAFNFLLAVLLFFLVLGVLGKDVAVFPTVVGSAPNALGLSPGDTVLAVNGVPVGTYEEATRAMADSPAGIVLAGTPAGRRETAYTLDGPEEAPGFQPFVPTVISQSIVGFPAYEAGLREGDRITALDGVPVDSWDDLLMTMDSLGDADITVDFLRGDSAGSVTLRPLYVEDAPRLGIVAATPLERIRLPLGQAFLYSVRSAAGATAVFFGTLEMLFTRPADLAEMSGGPIYVAESLGQEAGHGVSSLLEAVGGVSIAVMCFNLLPIPLLDGGQILILLYEGITRRRPSRRGVQIALRISLMLILAFFVFIVWQDLSRVFLRMSRTG
jgi:regulator of sigma E protease